MSNFIVYLFHVINVSILIKPKRTKSMWQVAQMLGVVYAQYKTQQLNGKRIDSV
jgi:hypothetical protein